MTAKRCSLTPPHAKHVMHVDDADRLPAFGHAGTISAGLVWNRVIASALSRVVL
jgi:hypothetical protein